MIFSCAPSFLENGVQRYYRTMGFPFINFTYSTRRASQLFYSLRRTVFKNIIFFEMERECDADPTTWTLQDIRDDPHPVERLR